MKVLVLGAGKMTMGLLKGLKNSQNLSEWMIYSPSGSSAQKLASDVGARFVPDLAAIKNPDWILVGCKPQQLKDLKELIGDKFKGALFVSMLAAISEEDQKNILGCTDLIRIMPNLPVEHRDGIVLLSSESAKGRLSSFQTLFSKLGFALTVKEDEFEELTLLTGSGPAFFYEFAKNLSESFTSLDPETREKLVRLVLKGAARNLTESSKTLDDHTSAVTSKGGVTIAVLEKWREEKLVEFVARGIDAGKKRIEELRAILRS